MRTPIEEPSSGLQKENNPLASLYHLRGPIQQWPGQDNEMSPRPDHGELSYAGSQKLAGRKALITGGDSGIGRAVAIAFAREGADVSICHLPQEKEDAAETLRWVTDCGRRGFSFAGDLQDIENCHATLKLAAESMGGLDILVNNAAFQHVFENIEDLKAEDLERTFRTNFFSYIWMTQGALPYMTEGSVILNTASVNALRGNEALLDYAATKASILNFTKSLAPQLAKRGIRVNAVAPGPVWTPLITSTMGEKIQSFGQETLWKRAAQPIEIATSYVFLASQDGRYFTGQVLSPTGTQEGAR